MKVVNVLDFPDPAHCHSLLPARGLHPYYIVTPHYQRNSIGVRCLHLLVHWFNRLGPSAWIVAYAGGCDCPVVMMPNPWLTTEISGDELGRDGIAWGDSAEEIARARATVERMRSRYLATIAAFFPQLEYFTDLTQARAGATPSPTPLVFRGSGCRSMTSW